MSVPITSIPPSNVKPFALSDIDGSPRHTALVSFLELYVQETFWSLADVEETSMRLALYAHCPGLRSQTQIQKIWRMLGFRYTGGCPDTYNSMFAQLNDCSCLATSTLILPVYQT